LALLVSIAGAGVLGQGAEGTEAGGPNATAMSVDTDATGNSAAVIGANDSTAALNPCDTFTIDVTITDIPASNPMIGFGFSIAYGSANVDIQTSAANYLLAVDPQSSLFDPGPSFSPNSVTVSAADIGVNAEESGSGVLARLTGVIPANAVAGSYPLTLGEAALLDTQNQPRTPDVLNSGTFNIDGSCNGDVDCSLSINSVDSLKVLRHNAGLSVTQSEPCANIGSDIGPRNQGDVDCSGTVNSVDALKILRSATGLTITQGPGCPLVVP
jgi:hypothetical protein